MSLTLLPSLDLSSTQESLKFEVTCPGRLDSRPALSPQASFATDISTSSRRSRPTLSPEALLTHAFGPLALNWLARPPPRVASPSSISESSQSTSSSTSSSSRGPSSPRRRKRDCLPAPPPPGTFRSVAKPSKSSPSQLSPSEPKSFQIHSRQTTGELIRVIPSQDFERVAEREPPMSPIQWREKAEERLQRRKLLRVKSALQEVVKLPLDIDCRPMEGSMGLPPTGDFPKARKPKVNERSPSLTRLAVSMAGDMKEGNAQLFSVEEEEDKTVIGEAPDWPKSMVEMKEIVSLVKQCDAICLKNLSG